MTGGYVDTHANDGTAEAVTERESGGKPSKRHSYLEHKWVLNVEGGTSVIFNANVWAPPSSDGDQFVLAYSTDDIHYGDMFTVTATSDNGGYQAFALPPSTSGTVYVRVVDTDRSQGQRELDTVYLDHAFIRTYNEPGIPPEAPTGLLATAMSASQIDLAWTDNADNEDGFQIERSPGGAVDWALIDTVGPDTESYSDTGLQAATSYDYRVQAHNGSGGSGYSNVASATTGQGSFMHVGDLDGSSQLGKRSRWSATVVVTVHDQGHVPLVGATVSGSWSTGATGGGSCVTGAAGQCSITKSNIKSNVSSVAFTVDDVALTGYTYLPADNHDPDGDSDGTQITILSP